MAKTKAKSKKESLEEAVAEAVGAGRELHLPTVDFSDPNRPKTCLEVDFPILPINHVAAIEGNAGKPIYQMSKWWARRRSSVFRAMLIAGATEAPHDSADAAKVVWDAYYGNHQKNAGFRQLKVADIFMGGGTTVVEGSRLGMRMYGNDLNPVAWFVVKNELAQVDPKDVKKLLDHIEAEVKPQIMPFYACNCPRGHKGKWTQKSTGKVMGNDFDPLSLTPEQRPDYEYAGPEVIYTFWAKHGPCQATECNHRTPIMSSPVIAVKTLTVKAWVGRECSHCEELFDVERHEARMAPGALFVVADDEKPYVVMDDAGKYACPHCGHKYHDQAAAMKNESSSMGKAKSKKITLTLLIHPDWLKGANGCDDNGAVFGGSMTDSAEATQRWTQQRAMTVKLIEHRGNLPQQLICPDTKDAFFTDGRGGTMPKKAAFTCQSTTCGLGQDVYDSLGRFGKTGPVAIYAVQGYCPECDQAGLPYGGRFFDVLRRPECFDAANRDWELQRNGALSRYWPKSEIPYGLTTHIDRPLPHHGYTHWWTMFNGRQLLCLSYLLKAIDGSKHSVESKDAVLCAFQQFLRNNNMFCFWDLDYDKLVPMMSNNNYAPKITVVENSVFSPMGRGNWKSCTDGVVEAFEWSLNPWEVVSVTELAQYSKAIADQISTKSVKAATGDPVGPECTVECCSATSLSLSPGSVDLVITDPPFGNLLHYSELADFFYVWFRLVLRDRYPSLFQAEYTPKALEAVANKARNPNDYNDVYKRILTECWREARRVLKSDGLLAFTFHHSEDEPWVAVLESLFDAGFFLEATYPIRSDETKGDGEFGSQKIEFDIIHVCRKRVDDPKEISWARLRRQIMQDVQQLKDILEQHQTSGLQEADLQVIRRGKALEYYSKHYGKVYVEKGREFTVREALVGINQLLDDERDTDKESPPVNAEPFTRQFLRLFAGRTSLPRDQMQKYLRGTGVSANEFESRGWCHESQKVFHVTSPLELAKEWKGVTRSGMSRDFDQAMFLVGACYENSGIRVSDTLDSPHFTPHPATGEIIDWLTRHGGSSEIKNAASLAKQLYGKWQAANKPKVEKQRSLFDLEEVGV